MNPTRLTEMISTGSPDLTDHALRQAIKLLEKESPRSCSRSPYAITALTHGLPNAELLIRRAVQLRSGHGWALRPDNEGTSRPLNVPSASNTTQRALSPQCPPHVP